MDLLRTLGAFGLPLRVGWLGAQPAARDSALVQTGSAPADSTPMPSSRWLWVLLTLFVSLPCAAQEWQPLRTGLRWTYKASGVDTFTFGGMTQTVNVEGTRKVLVREPSAELPGSPYEIVETRAIRTEGEPGTTDTTIRSWVRGNERGLQGFGVEFEDPFSGVERVMVRYEPPLQYLPPNPRVGQTWHVGVEKLDGVRIDLQGEIVGLRDVKTPAGLHRGCLQVSYSGPISGSLASPEGPLRIQRGTVTMTSYYARGIGPVREEEHQDLTLSMPNGMLIQGTSRAQYLLESSNLLNLPASPR